MRAALIDEQLHVVAIESRSMPPSTPFPGLVEFDAAAMAAAVIQAATTVLERGPAPVAVGITNQRASTIVWDRTSGEPIGPGIGWQDLRTVFDCITAKAERGLSLAPNQSITKLAWLLANVPGAGDRDLCFGTVDSWLGWTLSDGTVHVTDHTNAAVTGLCGEDPASWNNELAAAFGIPVHVLPRIVDSSGVVGEARVLPGAPPIAGVVGDQQGSLIGQGCVRRGQAKITFGSGGMFDLCTGAVPPTSHRRGGHGTYPIVAWSRNGALTWGTEAIMLSAGTNVQWLVEDLGIIDSPAASHEVAASVQSTDGVVYVPALLGLGTPNWDFGARGTLLGDHPRHDYRPHRAGRARWRGTTGRRSRRGGRIRHGSASRDVAHRRRHERQSNVRSFARRLVAAADRGLPDRRRHDVGGRVPGWARRRDVGRRG